MDKREFALNLIAAEEQSNRPETREPDDEKLQLYLIEQENITRSSTFVPSSLDEDDNLRDLPIEQPGVLDSLIVISNSADFGFRLEIDSDNVIDKSFSDILSISRELSHIGAYSDSGKHYISVGEYPFNERLFVRVTPRSEILFDLVRVEALINGDLDDAGIGADPEVIDALRL